MSIGGSVFFVGLNTSRSNSKYLWGKHNMFAHFSYVIRLLRVYLLCDEAHTD